MAPERPPAAAEQLVSETIEEEAVFDLRALVVLDRHVPADFSVVVDGPGTEYRAAASGLIGHPAGHGPVRVEFDLALATGSSRSGDRATAHGGIDLILGECLASGIEQLADGALRFG